ncbi:hypothetical protein CBR_g57863 [Chara braunii]|uniref:Uncharacterized protein n=1 Tax=Chara braunii TaxID=69332 RepID=A0A388K8K0_CHABU|nr:hypothetical protein CBR_g57863 [Chara braunii]|eukprot:GBG66263.1 hypothetical protein CBR_g57863 [Chara braunii]
MAPTKRKAGGSSAGARTRATRKKMVSGDDDKVSNVDVTGEAGETFSQSSGGGGGGGGGGAPAASRRIVIEACKSGDDGKVYVSLLSLPRPFAKLKALDLEALSQEIADGLKNLKGSVLEKETKESGGDDTDKENEDEFEETAKDGGSAASEDGSNVSEAVKASSGKVKKIKHDEVTEEKAGEMVQMINEEENGKKGTTMGTRNSNKSGQSFKQAPSRTGMPARVPSRKSTRRAKGDVTPEATVDESGDGTKSSLI